MKLYFEKIFDFDIHKGNPKAAMFNWLNKSQNINVINIQYVNEDYVVYYWKKTKSLT